MSTGIEWTDETWNPVTGCNKISPGCKFCYAKRLWKKVYPGREFEDVQCHPERLDKPWGWAKPRMVFVNSMSDLFHEKVPFEFIDRVFAVMALCPQHTFQILTKRPERMLEYMTSHGRCAMVYNAATPFINSDFSLMPPHMAHHRSSGAGWWPLPNVWPGVSVEDQTSADERIPRLLQTLAAVRWVSYEPALGPVDFREFDWFDGSKIDPLSQVMWLPNEPDVQSEPVATGLDWIVCGGESGPGVRPMHPAWARSVRDQCQAAGVAFFFKQWGEHSPITTTDGLQESPFGYDVVSGLGFTKVGKKAAGRLLDGREWNEMPAALSPAPATTEAE